jgi:hypothetical protein
MNTPQVIQISAAEASGVIQTTGAARIRALLGISNQGTVGSWIPKIGNETSVKGQSAVPAMMCSIDCL